MSASGSFTATETGERAAPVAAQERACVQGGWLGLGLSNLHVPLRWRHCPVKFSALSGFGTGY